MSSITPEAIDKVLSIAPANIISIDGYAHIDKDKNVRLFTPPVPEPIRINTLSGFIGLLETGFEGFDPTKTVVHVDHFDEVDLIDKASDKYGRRQTWVKAKALPADRAFKFNEYIAQEEFVIALRTMFVQTSAMGRLVGIAGNLSAKNEVKQEDDGFTQNVTARAGVVRLAEITVNPRVTLQPFRTFLEVDQPEGEFVFRVKNVEGRGNMCALFEADGGRWKLTAMDNVKKYLSQQIKTSTVEAITSIPVIS